MSLQDIIEAVTHFEEERCGRFPASKTFIRYKTWLVERSTVQMRRLIFLMSSASTLPGLTHKHVINLMVKRALKGAHQDEKTYATAMQFKEDGMRMRAFYNAGILHEKPVCLKVIPSHIGDKTRHEIEIRQRLDQLQTITVPRIYDTFERDGYIYILEEMIYGRRFNRFRDNNLFLQKGLPELLATYKACCAETVSLQDLYGSDLYDKTALALQSLSNESTKAFLSALDGAMKRNSEVPNGLCHNDLMPSNLAVSRDRLYFLDWEEACDGAFLSDLLSLVFKYKQQNAFQNAILDGYQTAFPTDNVHRDPDHITVRIAERIVSVPKKKRAGFLALWGSLQA